MRCAVILLVLASVGAACSDDNLPAGGGPGSAGALKFKPCRTAPLECATLVVPADWSAPDGPTIALPVVWAPATILANRIGALTFNFGGPGEATLEPLAENYPTQPIFSSTDLTEQFDFAMIDWRGVATSMPALSCFDTDIAAQMAAERFAPQTDEEWTQLFALVDEVSASCAANASNAPLLVHQDTESAARDFDALRAGLGEDQLNMWDVSYGTRVGAMYATLFPDRVRAIALDSPVTPAPDFEASQLAQNASFEAQLGRFFTWCAAASVGDCPFQLAGGSAADVSAAYELLLTNADKSPVIAMGITLDRATIDQTAMTMMYFPQVQWQPLAAALSQLQTSTGEQLAQLFIGNAQTLATGDNAFSSLQNVFYQDSPPPAELATPAAYQQWVESQAASAPHEALQNLASSAFSVAWPTTAPTQTPIGNAAAPPLLITATRHDPATPYPGALALQQAFANGSYLVTFEGDGHANAQFNQCLGDVTAAFIVDPTTPPATADCADLGIDGTTAAAAHGARFHAGRVRR